MKNDSILTTRMDLPEGNVLHMNDIDEEKEFIDRSSYTNDFEEETDNVNTPAMEWPVRHNSENERFPFTCNGFQRAKAPRYTCTGRITRVPSRYLDTDSDSSDGSKRKAAVSSCRLKVKRRRKSSSTNNRLLVNGYKEHDAFPLENIHSDGVVCNLSKNEMESLANLECSEVFEGASPVSNDKIPASAHETQARTICQGNNTLTSPENNTESSLKVKVNGVLSPKCDNVPDFSLKEASMCCPQTTAACVDISAENKGQARFASSSLSTGQRFENVACHKPANGDVKAKGSSEYGRTDEVSATCSINAHLKNKTCDSSTKPTFVSSMELISKQREVSCASLKVNDHDISPEKSVSDVRSLDSVATSSVSGYFPTEIATGKDGNKKIDLLKDAILSVTCPENREKPQQLVDNEKPTGNFKEDCSRKPQGLNCFRNFKMGRGYARKLNQKQMRRASDRTNSKNGLKKQSLLDQIKRQSVNKVKKTAKLQKNNLKQKIKKGVQKNAKPVNKTADDSQVLDSVLGMRKDPNGGYEFLVQWANGTSCWVSSDKIVSNKQNGILRQYFMENEQDISVINRIPFQAYCCDSLSLKETQEVPTIFKKRNETKKEVVIKRQPTVTKCMKKGEVFVEINSGHYYITLNRETCKRKLTCLKIVNELITALEDASVSDCNLVIIRGLGSKVFGGLDIEGICKVNTEETGNMILQKTRITTTVTSIERDNNKIMSILPVYAGLAGAHTAVSEFARYLVQTLSNYPKPLVGLVSRPAEGIGAVLLSLFDMICDEESWKKDGFIENSTKSCDSIERYCLPRVIGHSIPCEEILMGKNCVQPSEAVSSIPETMFKESDSSTVMGTLREIESTIHRLGKKTASFIDMSDEELLNMTINQVTNLVNAAGCVSLEGSQDDSGILNDTPSQHSLDDNNHSDFTGSAPADRYVKELESQIIKEKHLVQKYIEEISNIWNGPSTTLLSHGKS